MRKHITDNKETQRDGVCNLHHRDKGSALIFLWGGKRNGRAYPAESLPSEGMPNKRIQ